ncbi:winged helix-turn-helix domain-containing protein [Opitutaceae bacterium EW11]|nr:winged helix-turn-helix domain-containing protein [Opitutaceae bacterium EW11]
MHHAKPLKLTREVARRFVRRALWLETASNDVPSALSHLGYIQLDPLNVCGRMQDLILRNRVAGYAEGDLLRAVHGEPIAESPMVRRAGFEHYIPGQGILCAWPKESFRFIRAHIELAHARGTHRAMSREEAQLGEFILKELAERGPLTSDDIEHEGRSVTAWGSSGRTVKLVLERLFGRGQVLISSRRGFRRVYDLAERVMPEAGPNAAPTEEELSRWRALLPVRQRRLVALKKRELELIADLVQPVSIEGEFTLYCLRTDTPLLEEPADEEEPSRLQLLAPLDPLIYDRRVTRRLWNFDFTWEVYTPAAKRKRGYYSLPVLAGNQLVGDVEPRANWKTGRLSVASRRIRRGFQTAAAVAELAGFLNLR